MMNAVINEKNLFTFVELRLRANLTQKQLAARLEDAFGRAVSGNAISCWERGIHQPRLTPHETRLACAILGCTLDELADATINVKD